MLTSIIGQAQEQSEKILRMDEVVISTARTEMPVFDVPQSVTVLTSEQIMASPFDRVEDIVRSVPGVYNFRHYGLQTHGIVSPLKMRGVGNNRILVLVDGVPQNDNFNNAIAWVAWGHIPKETIERIEIVRGPTSALYGSEGLGGVIHIITKKPKAKRQTSVRGEAGMASTYGGYGFHSQKIKDLGFMVAGGYEKSDGFYMVKDPKTYEIKRYREVGKVLGKATFDLSPSSDISLAGLYFDYDGGQGRQFFYNELKLDQYWLNYTHTGDAFGLKGLVYLNRAHKTAYQDQDPNYNFLQRTENFRDVSTWGVDLQGTALNWKPVRLTVGAAYKQVNWEYDEDHFVPVRDVGAEGNQQFISPFVNIDFRFFNESLIINMGGRYDWIKTSDGRNYNTTAQAGRPPYDKKYDAEKDSAFSPKLGIAWHPDEKTTLRASGGKGFRVPSLFELYKVHIRQGGRYYREANPNLKPEVIWSYDAGAERFLLNNLWGRVTFYQSFAEDYIGDRFLRRVGTRNEYKLDNISKVNIYGLETELEWYPRNDLTIFANYTFNISKVKEDKNNPALEGNYLPNDPRHIVHFGLRYQNPKIVNISLVTNYYAKIYYDNENTLKTKDYWTVDIGVSRKFFDRFTAYVNAENIFDKKYPLFKTASFGDTCAPGVIVMGGVKFEF
ncbi:MAG: TonB-dependent receptor plug domain-containing protein [Candidatus Hadarchaeaceae archaeon]